MSVIANDLRKGMAILWKNDPCVVEEMHHRCPGKGRAFVQVIFRSLTNGRAYDQRFASNERLEQVLLEHTKWEFSYKDPTGYNFINPETYESITIEEKMLKDSAGYLIENLPCEFATVDGKIIEVALPSQVSLKVISSPQGLKGDTATNAMKPATLETGITIQVPLFIKEGDMIKVDTREGKYVSRVNE